jgi:DNA-binding CsgD family transcriptional regulator
MKTLTRNVNARLNTRSEQRPATSAASLTHKSLPKSSGSGQFSNPVSNPISNPVSNPGSAYTLLQGLMEGLIDGLMIISNKGELIHANQAAFQLCQHLDASFSQMQSLPQQIWRCCQAVMDSRELFPERLVIIEDELESAIGSVRIRVQMMADNLPHPCLMVTLEDQAQSAQYRAIADAVRYGLTARETDVWRLKRAGCSYKEIAAQLFLAENTVKKHIKNIHVKRAALV